MGTQRKGIIFVWEGWVKLYRGEVLELGLEEGTVLKFVVVGLGEVGWGGAQGHC